MPPPARKQPLDTTVVGLDSYPFSEREWAHLPGGVVEPSLAGGPETTAIGRESLIDNPLRLGESTESAQAVS